MIHPDFRPACLSVLLCTLALACSSPPPPSDAASDGGTGSDTGTPPTCSPVAEPTLFSDTGQYTRELYVDRVRGTDDGDGSRERPWRTISASANDRQAGDRVHIAAGTYFECLQIGTATGTAANPIQFIGDGEVRLHCMNGEAIAGTGLAYLTIEHLIVLASSDDMNAIHIDGNSNHIVIRRCEVAGVGRGGDCIKVNQSDDVWVLENDVHDVDTLGGSSQGIDLVGVHRGLVRRNHVHDIADSQGIFVKGGASDIVIERNRIERLASQMSDAIGIVVGGVTDRVFFSPANAEFEAFNIIARNNVVIGADGAGIGAQACRDCWIVNNTLWNTGHRGYAIQLSQGATGMAAPGDGISHNHTVRVMNNLIGNPDGTMRAPIQAEPIERTGLELANNWWWNGPRDDVFDPGYNSVVGVDGAGSHLGEDPLVVNADMMDLRLSSQSGARGAARMLDNVPDDYTGACRTHPMDIGAYRAQ